MFERLGLMNGPVQPYPIHSALEMEDAKDALRSAVRANRKNRSERLREEAGQQFADVIDSFPDTQSVTCVAAYVSRSSEPRTNALLELLASRGVRVLLPVLGSGLERGWAEFDGLDDLMERAPGRPPEPGTESQGPEALAQADLVIAPALAVDTSGVRLGQGGGWYDRALSHRRPEAKVIAVVFPEEVYDAEQRPLPAEPHDVLIDAVVTTDGYRWLSPAQDL